MQIMNIWGVHEVFQSSNERLQARRILLTSKFGISHTSEEKTSGMLERLDLSTGLGLRQCSPKREGGAGLSALLDCLKTYSKC